MFGKDYSNEISELWGIIKTIEKQQGEILKIIKSIQKECNFHAESLIKIARIQATHKESVTFLLNHATVDEDARADFFKMLKKVGELNIKA